MVIPPFDLSSQLSALGDELDQAVLDVLRSGRYIGGTVVTGFEQAFAAFCEVSTAVGCNSGTDALVLALRALGIGPGDEVITTSFSFFATAEAISRVGARPVFVDVDPATYLMDLDRVEAAITLATRALLPVHLFGRPVDMEQVVAIADRHGLRVVEDCAQATGASWAGRPVGSWGDLGCFSFFPTKNLGAAGDGGAVTGSDPELMQRVRELAVHGMPRRYLHTDLGYNSRLDALQAAVLTVKLPHLRRWITARRTIADRYRAALVGHNMLQLPAEGDDGHSWNQFVVRVPSCDQARRACGEACSPCPTSEAHGLPEGRCRNWFQQHLLDQEVQTIIYYPIPIHRQPAYAFLGLEPGSLPVTEALAAEVLSLPIFPELTEQQQRQVLRSLGVAGAVVPFGPTGDQAAAA
jgi:dTDP-4-amino-4,6-dideoxygalactose transaminase